MTGVGHPSLTYDYGPQIEPDGTRFRLWAPNALAVGVAIDPGTAGEKVHPLQNAADGWHMGFVADVGPGRQYLFDLGDTRVPDPASRFQPRDVMGPSEIVDPDAWHWQTDKWNGRPFSETVIYELHVGAFSPEGTFEGVIRRLDHLEKLGITAVELMPVSDFSGQRNWGYDGVLPFAPDSSYGRPEDLKRLVVALHQRGMMAYLDVVYNHFGPEGNFLHQYASDFFTDRIATPWGPAIDFSRPQVRRFFIENALYYLNEYRFDGLRLDAVQEIHDDREPHFLNELAGIVRATLGVSRHIHLILENDANQARYLARDAAGSTIRHDAQWNDDHHHVAHRIVTGEVDGYYAEYREDAIAKLGKSLTEGFVYQGEPSPHRGGLPRGEPSGHLPTSAFVNFLQNHDQIGNRALGERLSILGDAQRYQALRDLLLLAPQPPLLFMGEEWASRRPFLFFCDFHDALADAVRQGRREEFAAFSAFADPAALSRIPDPNAIETFEASALDWDEALGEQHRHWLTQTSTLLALRKTHIVPLIGSLNRADYCLLNDDGLQVRWYDETGLRLTVVANLGPGALALPAPEIETPLYATRQLTGTPPHLAPWSVIWWTPARIETAGEDLP